MSRVVDLTFEGNARGAVGAAKQTVEAIDKVKRTANEQAASNIAKRVEERRSLEQIAGAYRQAASAAKKGSEEQVAALKLEQRALRELNDQHAVHSRRLASSTHELERFSKGAVLGSGVLGHLGRTAAIASGSFLGGLGVIEVLKQATEGGAALQTQLQRTDKVFGDNAASIKAWSRDSVKALGLARAETLDYAASIGTLLQNMGLTPAASAAMSRTLLQRAADVAAFKGVDAGDVVGAFNAGLQGRTRALKQYGIVLDQTAIKQEAERLGLVRNTVDLGKVRDATEQVRIAEYNLGKQVEKHGAQSAEAAKATITLHNAERQLEKAHKGHAEALTADQRAQATYNAILEQTGKEQGWLAGHVTNLSVQERILKAEEKELFEIMGTGLIPMLTHYLPLLTSWIDRNEKNGTFQRDFNTAVKVAGDVVAGVIPVVKTIVGVWKDFADEVGGSKNALLILGGVMAGKKVLGVIQTVTESVKTLRTTLLSLGSAAVIGAVIAAAQAVKEINATNAKQARLDQGGQQIFGDSFEGHKPGSAPFVASKGVFKGQTVQVQTINGQNWVMPVTVQTQTNVHATGPGSDAVNWSGDYAGLDPGFKSKLEQCVAAAGGTSINVTSGRRSAAHNTAVGGAHNSNHLTGHAADGTCLINGHSYPLGDAPLAYGKFGLRAGRTFDWGGAPDVYHVDDGTNVGGAVTPAADSGTTTGADTGAAFVEKPKPPKKHADPIASYRTQVKTAISQINDDVDKGLFPKSVGDRLAARAEQIQQALTHATKADIPKIRTQMRDLNEAVQSALRASRDQTLLGRDEGQIRTDVKDGLLSKTVGDSLIAQARAINERLVKDIFDPKKSAADDAAAKGFRARIAAMLSQAAEVRTIDADTAKAQLDVRQQLEQALGVPVEHASQGAVAKARAGIAKIRAEFAANKVIPAAEKTKLKQQLAGYEAVVADGMQGVIDTVNQNRSRFETSWSKLASAALSGFDKETSKQLSKMQKDAATAIQQLQVTVQGSGFASFLFGGAVGQTPTEQLIAAREAARRKTQDASSIDDARKQLSDAQAALAAYGGPSGGTAGVAGHDPVTLASGDTVTGIGVGGSSGSDDLASLQQAVVDAQKQLDDAIYQQENDDLQDKATLERDAADKALAAAQQTAQDTADQQQQAYQDQRDSLRTHIQDMFDDAQTAIETGQKPLAQALSELGDQLGMNLAGSFASWFDPSNPNSVTATLASFLYQVELAKGKTPSQAAVNALGSLPPSTSNWGDAIVQGNIDFRTGFDANGIPIRGFASGGWADRGRPRVDRRDTIPALLRRGEYVMTPEEVAAGGPSWAGGRQSVGDVYLDGKKVGVHIARHVTDAQERQIGYTSSRG